MAIWPFSRRSGRKRSRSRANLSDVEAPPQSPFQSLTANYATAVTASDYRTVALKKQRLERRPSSKRPSRRVRTYSFSPGGDDSIRVAGLEASDPQGPGQRTGPFPPRQNDGEQKGDPDSVWQRAPTLLHNARHPQKLSLRKMTKRRRAETDREAEIKAMSNFAPVRPAAESWSSGRPIKKQSKRIKTGHAFRSSYEERRSDISLPISIHSSMSSDSEMHSFRVSALEALAPRPTLRYAVYQRRGAGSGPANGSGQSRPQQQKRKVSERVPESVLRAHKRVNSFADELDAADLRELMERDNRRREKRKQRDQERVERRLAKRAEKQREAEAEARKNGSPPPLNMERGVMGREMMVGSEVDKTSPRVTYSTQRPSSTSSKRPARRSIEKEMAPQPVPTGIHRTSSIQADIPISLPPQPPAESSLERTPSKKLVSKASMRLRRGLLRSKKSRSRSPNASDEEQHTISSLSSRQGDVETSRKISGSSHRALLAISTIFRWGSKKRKHSGPSSFSNTSREEMQAAAAQSHIRTQAPFAEEAQAPPQTVPPPTNYIPRKVSSGVPKRTRSRFREDLPELPLGRPDSVVGLSAAEEPLPMVPEAKSKGNILHESPATIRHDTPTSEIRQIDDKMERLEKMRQTPTSQRHSIQPSPDPVSLASIDSEGSWLSGRVSNRRSLGMRASGSRLQPQDRSQSPSAIDTEEELVDDEYLSSLATPSHDLRADERMARKSTGEAFPSSDEEELVDDADMKLGSIEKQRAMVMQQQRIKSREVILNNTFEDEDMSLPDLSDGETPKLQRATSVSLSRANSSVKRVNSGSIKMLEISPRTSIDQRTASGTIL